MRKPEFVLYPFLAAAYPVFALASTNPSEIPGLWVLVRPLSIALLVALAAWLTLTLFIRDPDRRAFFTLNVVLLFSSYGYLVMYVGQVDWAAPFAFTIFPFAFLVAYLAVVSYLVLHLVPDKRRLTRFLTILTAILVCGALVSILYQRSRSSTFAASTRPPNRAESSPAVPNRTDPDIYLIVLDKYTGAASLGSNFGFDNSEFEAFLTARGFAVPGHPQANYIYTQLSLASLLNFRYLDELSPDPGMENRTKAYLNQLVEDSAVRRFLQARGYRFIFFPTAFPVTGANRFADVQLPDPRRILTEFEIVWRRTSLAQPVLAWACQHLHCTHGVTSFTAEVPESFEWKFDQLSQLPQWPRDGRPLFVFAHLTIPHEPYVFNADCSVRPPLWPPRYAVRDETPEKHAYIAQITCLNRRLKSIVDRLLQDSPTPPVIILQSDHGHGRMIWHIPDVDSVTPDRRAERTDIFAAYFLPGADTAIVSDSITPVNVFRTVFRQYFQADLPPLPNRTYWSSGSNMFKFTRINRGQLLPK